MGDYGIVQFAQKRTGKILQIQKQEHGVSKSVE